MDSELELTYHNRQVKRITVRLLLIFLVLTELWLVTGFLPQQWQETMYARLTEIWPSKSYDYSRITHPNLHAELQPYKPVGMALLAILAVANGCAIVVLWRRRNT